MPPGTTPPNPWLDAFYRLFNSVETAVEVVKTTDAVRDVLEEYRELAEKAREELNKG